MSKPKRVKTMRDEALRLLVNVRGRMRHRLYCRTEIYDEEADCVCGTNRAYRQLYDFMSLLVSQFYINIVQEPLKKPHRKKASHVKS